MNDQLNHIKLIAIDLDGTLINHHNNISAVNINAIQRARVAGIKVVIASGRPPFGILPLARKLNLNCYLIAYNGSMLIDMCSEKVVFNRPLLARDAHAAIRLIRKHGLYVSSHCGMDYYADQICKEMDWEASMQRQKHILVNDLILDAPAQPNKLEVTSLDGSEHLDLLWMDLLKEMPQLRLHHMANRYVEIMHQGASKETALALACGLMGIYPEQVMAIGNAMNDLGMLGFAGISVAMQNAPDYLKEAADWLTASNNEDGVAEAIHRLLDELQSAETKLITEKRATPSEQT